MMRKSALLLIVFLAACTGVWADAGTILIKGAEKACVYNSQRGRERTCFQAGKEGRGHKITVPEEQCKDLLYLIADGKSSWIRLRPGETVKVNVGATPWKFSGEESKINAYLYAWTQEFWLERPNFLTATVQMMFHEIPKEKKIWPEITGLYKPEYREWIENWEHRALAGLAEAKLKEEAFLAEQRERIHYNWIELQCLDFQMAKMKTEVPEETLEFIRQERFENPGFMEYPGRDEVLRIFFDGADKLRLFSYSSTDFLRKRAERIALPELRELYILNVLQGDFNYGYFYQGEVILETVRDMVVSEEGKKVWEKCLQQCRQWQSDPLNPEGKDVVYFYFEDVNGNKINPWMFRGKYLLIDVWATWCGPCKAQIPFLKQLAEDLKDRDIAFLSISADKPENKETWRKMLKEFGLEAHGVIAPDAFNHKIFEEYGIKGIPRFILVDPKGKVLISKARRPSDPVLKRQLEELLDAYDNRKTTLSGWMNLPESQVVLGKPGGMWEQIAEAKVHDHVFSLSALIGQAGFYSLNGGKSLYQVWLTPGAKISCDQRATPMFSGDHAGVNNLMAELYDKYVRGVVPVPGEVFDRPRGQRLKKQYDGIVRIIEGASLSQQEKDLVTGYWQGYFMNQMYGSIISAKVFGKAHQRPEVRKGYSDAALEIRLLPEVVHFSQWFGVLQEWLYAKLETGRIRIQGEDSWLADLAMGIENEELREAYIMEALRLDILRGQLHKIEARIEKIRPMVRKAENQKLLDVMPVQIEKNRKAYAGAMPGTDLSHFTFRDASGKEVSLADFKGYYIFIDMWSTGCNPCIGEIPYLRDLEKRLAGKPIVWISVSLDLQKQVWLDFLKKNKMTGIQLLCDKGFKHPFVKQIGLSGIPRFLLLDQEGKVIDVNTLRPSNPVLEKCLEFLLNEAG